SNCSAPMWPRWMHERLDSRLTHRDSLSRLSGQIQSHQPWSALVLGSCACCQSAVEPMEGSSSPTTHAICAGGVPTLLHAPSTAIPPWCSLRAPAIGLILPSLLGLARRGS